MIKSLLHFNNPNNLTKDEVSGIPWKVNGTVASSQDGRFGNCLSLNGDGYLQNNTIDLSLDKEWTLDMWVYSSNYAVPDAQSFFSIASCPSPKAGIRVQNDKIIFGLKDNTWFIYLLNLPAHRWLHFALVNYASNLYVFVDGVKKVERTNQDVVLATTPEILIGLNRSISTIFNGLIDEFRVSDKALWTFDFTPPTHESPTGKYIYIDKNNTVMGMKE